jgi:hypothetical protein
LNGEGVLFCTADLRKRGLPSSTPSFATIQGRHPTRTIYVTWQWRCFSCSMPISCYPRSWNHHPY